MRKYILQPHQKYPLLIVIGDLLIIFIGLSLVFFSQTDTKVSLLNILIIYFILAITTILSFYVLDLYDLSKTIYSESLLITIIAGLVMTIIIYSSLSYFIIFLRPGKINLILLILINGILFFIWHKLFFKVVKIKPQRLLFIGKEEILEDIGKIIRSNYSQYYTVVEHCHSHSHNPSFPNLINFVKDNNIDVVVYSVHSNMVKQNSNDLINIKFSHRNIIDAYNFYQRLTGKFPIYFVDNFWLIINAQREFFFSKIVRKLKRAFDLFFVLLFLPYILPILLVAILAIKLDSEGPVFFIQERLGQNEVPFRLIKLRTMIHHAERATGPQWSFGNDARITRVGRILRKLRLDEITQFVNVFRGEMSLVGPRPIRKHFADLLSKEIPFYRLRFLTKPGLTGWAQVNHDYAGCKQGQAEKLQYEIFYLVHQSIWLDLLILFRTVKVMVWGTGT